MRFIIRTQGFSSTYQEAGYHIYNSNQKRDESGMKLCQSQLLGTRVDQNGQILVLLLWCLFILVTVEMTTQEAIPRGT